FGRTELARPKPGVAVVSHVSKEARKDDDENPGGAPRSRPDDRPVHHYDHGRRPAEGHQEDRELRLQVRRRPPRRRQHRRGGPDDQGAEEAEPRAPPPPARALRPGDAEVRREHVARRPARPRPRRATLPACRSASSSSTTTPAPTRTSVTRRSRP